VIDSLMGKQQTRWWSHSDRPNEERAGTTQERE